jgi:UDP-hydrolysing UDP-N-acetyl-D-glucosamine 2-epimerase
VSGSRADYGLLVSPLRAIQKDPVFRLHFVLTGQHLVATAGYTAARARADGFDVAATIDLGLGDDTAKGVTVSAARALEGMAGVLEQLKPDLVLILGDRYEILCCALAATIARIPIAHIAGGDVTEGAIDDSFRHAITKMAQIHFVTDDAAARRVHQLGEDMRHIHLVGSPGLDLIRQTAAPTRDKFFDAVGLAPAKPSFLVTFHPVTRMENSLDQIGNLLGALASFSDAAILFTGSNADPEGRQIEQQIGAFVAAHPGARFIPSLGGELYFGALTHCDVVIGNSSSGIYEAPSFGIPTVNIGDRQKGRTMASSVIGAAPERDAIIAAIKKAVAAGRQPTVNPYGDGHASEKIVAVLKSLGDPRPLLAKHFVDLPGA